ncbi:molybdenum-dependent transcriptional regulator [Enterobacteriaceae bacterium YMB-R22]|jgi:molybdate transport system regulatory protein|uniref:molybdenum-dependent transcriptional regulator n=1 Tax=Tenebrionicola larvae TaxID=2815733 RepID=UPI00201216C1|nr:molybdenum-dependent transcriptional regulator [Tenebrionicola larvae]MBV4412323.1 molybdenum-dependent transcriptional regulator [Tenebrionicola larvae]
MQAEILLTLKLHDRLFADPRRIALLKQIDHTGSISQGAKLAGISYKSAWDAIYEMNQLTDQTLVERATGGKGGGGAHLTAYGHRLIQLYELLAQIQRKAFDVLRDDTLALDSLLAAISRFSLQTSARNQLFGTVVRRNSEQVQQYVEILLADGRTSLKAAVTRQSGERLGLDCGKEVLVLIKAPWITLTRNAAQAQGADNQLSGVITRVESDANQSEILIRLPGAETLCATLPAERARAENFTAGEEVTAFFNADRVIVATLC